MRKFSLFQVDWMRRMSAKVAMLRQCQMGYCRPSRDSLRLCGALQFSQVLAAISVNVVNLLSIQWTHSGQLSSVLRVDSSPSRWMSRFWLEMSFLPECHSLFKVLNWGQRWQSFFTPHPPTSSRKKKRFFYSIVHHFSSTLGIDTVTRKIRCSALNPTNVNWKE